MFPIKKLISPTDFSESSRAGLDVAIEMAARDEAELILVHIIASLPMISGTYSMSGARTVQLVDEMQQEARRQMEKLVGATVPANVRCDARVIQGQPAEEVVRLAEDEKVDLIVIATHGYSGFNRFLFGSVAERVVRTAPCPVLTIRPTETQSREK